jgi:hypothetical protein
MWYSIVVIPVQEVPLDEEEMLAIVGRLYVGNILLQKENARLRTAFSPPPSHEYPPVEAQSVEPLTTEED